MAQPAAATTGTSTVPTCVNVVGLTPIGWLGAEPITVVLGLVYGYIPFMILPLFGFLDRIDQHLLEAGRDLGAGASRPSGA